MSGVGRVVLITVGVAFSNAVFAAPAISLHICVDKTPYPPFVYSEKINGAGQLRGYSLDLVKQLLTSIRSTYDIKLMSPADIDQRIQSADPKSGCDLVLDIKKTPALDNALLFTPAIYQLNFDIVYSWERFMTGLGVKSVADLKKLQMCGVVNYDYGSIAKQLKIHHLPNIKDAVFELKTKSCDGFIAEAAAMKYGQRLNTYQVPPVGCVRLDGTAKSYYIGIAKHIIGIDTLMPKIQQQFVGLSAKDGPMSKLAEAYDVVPMTCQETIKVAP